MDRKNNHLSIHRNRNRPLGVPELVAIALGGMVGGGIFTVLGISVSIIGIYTPLAILLGGIFALLAAYSYVKLSVYYQDEGATYSFFKRTFPGSPFAAAVIGWYVVFGYISTLALYAYTFSAYAISGFAYADSEWARKGVATLIIMTFTLVNVWSVRGMGKIEDIMVLTKLVILVLISFVLIDNSRFGFPTLVQQTGSTGILPVLMVAALTFVAYEGFQLVINAVKETAAPETDIPRAIYAAIVTAVTLYIIMSIGALLAIPFDDIINNREYALAAGAGNVLGNRGTQLVILGALLATSSAISGTLFGASRLMARIASDGYLPPVLAQRKRHIPVYAIIAMTLLAVSLVLVGGLELILEFGSMTFLLVSVLMALANHRIRHRTCSSPVLTLTAIFGLSSGMLLILVYEFSNHLLQMISIGALYLLLALGAWLYSRKQERDSAAG